jgi:hypothetical protein
MESSDSPLNFDWHFLLRIGQLTVAIEYELETEHGRQERNGTALTDVAGGGEAKEAVTNREGHTTISRILCV